MSSIPVKTLQDALKRTKKIVNTKSSIQVLTGVRLTVGMLEATNLEASIQIPVSTGLTAADDVIVPFGALDKTLKAIESKERIILSVDSNEFVITSEFGDTRLECLNREDWPETGLSDTWIKHNNACWKAAPDNLVADIKSLQRFASRDQSRPVLCGTCIEGGAIVATDSYHLGWIRSGLDLGTQVVFAAGYLDALDDVGMAVPQCENAVAT